MFWVVIGIWLGSAFLVGLFANLRGRDGIGWFALAILISAPSAGLLLVGLPRKKSPFAEAQGKNSDCHTALSNFRPEGVYAGITYMVTSNSNIVAVTDRGLARFRTMDDFLAAAKKSSSLD